MLHRVLRVGLLRFNWELEIELNLEGMVEAEKFW